MPQFHCVAKASQLQPGSCLCVEVQGRRIALFNLDGQFYAIDDVCTHQAGPLSEGLIEGDEVICPWHGARFKIKSGENTSPPAHEGVETFRVRVVGEDIEVEA